MVKLCTTCSYYIDGKDHTKDESVAASTCFVCLGLWQRDNDDDDTVEDRTDTFLDRLTQTITEATKPYGGIHVNRFAVGSNCININDQPRIVLPGDMVHRYKLATAAAGTTATLPVSLFADRLKKYATERLNHCLDSLAQKPLSEMKAEYPDDVIREEQGYLGIQVILTLHKDLMRPVDLLPLTQHFQNGTKRSRRQRQQLDISQGGDPRVNQEERVEHAYKTRIWTVNQAVATSHKSSQNDADILENAGNILPAIQQHDAMDVHVAVWRKPFYLAAKYTKSRRDVSQTPFFVNDHGAAAATTITDDASDNALEQGEKNTPKRRRLGITSVEEQILPVIENQVGGISTHNEQHTPMQNGKRFGMIKFHASGREDMNVRMMLPKTVPDNGKTICGRPFVCEVTDALRLPTKADLMEIVKAVNKTADSVENAAETVLASTDAKDVSRSYGCNPLGVDISPDLAFVHGSAYSSLQAETEEKIKHYACYCWSQKPFASLKSLIDQLQLHKFPLKIQQKTPIRVLHRRVNMTRIRHVLSCYADRVDDHHFILHISTDAGTYVKEWCHGDLGRTTPNLSTVLGCKTDILELDCEGIELG